MKTRITLTIEPTISHRAKAVARARGMSVSSLVESLLAGEIGEIRERRESRSFSERWAGRLGVKRKAGARYERLKSKYGI